MLSGLWPSLWKPDAATPHIKSSPSGDAARAGLATAKTETHSAPTTANRNPLAHNENLFTPLASHIFAGAMY
ncbi:hypothetical protein GOEFS_077_00200 [Gordonia effusa NBRC 100432]|uniref:Uncharacterized protein n=1 Tax=Gordonia effusa NBRC 100432 TaxID=1077974 RepID=H0R2C7_9ACTN|nr:hypothetical protein GOEFS_077_00200 [Gordonia effusa NBRC 100432]